MSGSEVISPGIWSGLCAHGSVAGCFASNRPKGAINVSRLTRSGQIAAISAANEPPTELPTRSAPASPALSMISRTASTQSRWLSSTVCPRSPPGKPGSEGAMTVRASASRSRNGTHRGRPPKPARNPIRAPVPLRQTRVVKPLMSMVDASGSFTLSAPRAQFVSARCHKFSAIQVPGLAASRRKPVFAGIKTVPSGSPGGSDRGKGRQRRALLPVHRLRPPAVLPLGEHVLKLRHDLLGEQPGIVFGKVLRHVAELHEQHELADIERRGKLAHLLDDLVGGADDDVAIVDDALHVTGKRLHLLRRRGVGGWAAWYLALGCHLDLALDTRALGRLGHVAGWRGKANIDMQAAPVEVFSRSGVEFERLLPALRYAHHLGEARPVGIAVLPEPGHFFPKTFHDVPRHLVAIVRQVAEHVIHLGGPSPGLDRSRAWNPDRRVWLLDRPRPDVHVALLVEAAVERECLLLGPGAQDEVMGFVVALPQLAWIGAVRVRGVHWRADREAGDETTAGNSVDHGELFGDPCWRIVEGKAVAKNADRRIGGAPSEG